MQQRRSNGISVGVGLPNTRKPHAGLGWNSVEHELDVRHVKLGAGLDESVQATGNHGARTTSKEVGTNHAYGHPIESHLAVKIARLPAGVTNPHSQMILQIVAHRQIYERLDIDVFEMIGWTNPRQHKKLRRIESTGRDNHFSPCTNGGGLAAVNDLNADRAMVFDDDS